MRSEVNKVLLWCYLLLAALVCIVLGMGLPTTANYIVVSSLMAPVIVSVGAQSGLIVPLIAVHMFVFYFGILADDTPPVGLAAYAAAAIAKSSPIPTGIQGFMYDIRTAILPFMFIFNTDLILHNVNSWPQGLLIFAMACLGNFAFASATWHFSTEKLPEEARADLFGVTRTYFRRVQTGDEYVLEPLSDGAWIETGDQLGVPLSIRAKHAAEYVHVRPPSAERLRGIRSPMLAVAP